ncbi:ComF family protein [Leucobacter denitrificans]|uniref:ComF family protein n=1 Tax=Leucobacter denitrificans TaxID=683042 RepID=A0A7G9S3P3_9MICO|nr:phosphoribosyltransferase family protein [Leucobacter denitrificans]QNN62468.1 ComF family protein [Leucobacter denitrificans]
MHPEHLSAGPPYYVAGAYEGVVRDTLIAFKHDSAYGFVKPLGSRLGRVLRAACREAGADPPLLVTVPSRPARVRSRGYRHVDALVRVAVRRERLPLDLVNVLRVLRGRTGQVGLDAESRERNARRVAVRKRATKLAGREVILVDDIVTTGATTRAACEVLEAAGMRVIAVVALCHAVRKDSSQKTQVEE